VKLRFTLRAAQQLNAALDYIVERNPRGARKIQSRIQDIMLLISQYPFAGNSTKRSGIRSIVTTPYPYAIFYRIGDGEIVILAIRHTARRKLV
jgi:plasmid stabilization system protein ParE